MITIQYGVDKNSGMIWSKVGYSFAVPVLQTDQMTKKNGLHPIFELEKFEIDEVNTSLGTIKWTQIVPNQIKNLHREFWGMKPLGE
jgi:hypothetical protein